jgi:hypothetical protein
MGRLAAPGPGAYLAAMNYVLALLLPPLSILLAGRPILAIVVFLIWVPSILISGGLGHPIFILLAWIVVYQAGEERRHREAMRSGRRDE